MRLSAGFDMGRNRRLDRVAEIDVCMCVITGIGDILGMSVAASNQ